jgi:hypothetical protein
MISVMPYHVLCFLAVMVCGALAQSDQGAVNAELRTRVERTGAISFAGGNFTHIGLPVTLDGVVKAVIWDTGVDPLAAAAEFGQAHALGVDAVRAISRALVDAVCGEERNRALVVGDGAPVREGFDGAAAAAPPSARVLVLGDSHARLFSVLHHCQREFAFEVAAVVGASAHGVLNARSTTNALGIFRAVLDATLALPPPSPLRADVAVPAAAVAVERANADKATAARVPPDLVLIHVGEVDTGSLAFERSRAKNITVDEQLRLSAARLLAFVDDEVCGEGVH